MSEPALETRPGFGSVAVDVEEHDVAVVSSDHQSTLTFAVSDAESVDARRNAQPDTGDTTGAPETVEQYLEDESVSTDGEETPFPGPSDGRRPVRRRTSVVRFVALRRVPSLPLVILRLQLALREVRLQAGTRQNDSSINRERKGHGTKT